MCGLFFGVDVQNGRDAMMRGAHRGPDLLAFHKEEVAGRQLSIGHARLSIIDLSDASAQPMVGGARLDTQDELTASRYLLIFNGAIYNFRELRDELASFGGEFRSDGDAEVLLQALIHWGEEALVKLSGMFAFVFLDRSTGEVLAARDRFGIKPLYYIKTPDGGLAFASEIKQLLPYSKRRMDRRAAFDFLEGGLTDHREETFFEGIRQIRGGQLARVSLTSDDPKPEIKRWWHVSQPPKVTGSLEKTSRRFRTLFDQSIRRHLISDVAVGSCLSGGLDSSSIVSTTTPYVTRLQTFTAEFPGTAVDESQYARAVAGRAGADYTAVRPEMKGLWSDLDSILFAQDEPFGSTSIYAQWSVFRAARAEGIKVMLDGQGADELLAGYHANFVFAMAAAISRGRFMKLRALVKGYRYLGHDSRPVLRQAAQLAAEYGAGKALIARRRTRSRVSALREHWLHAPGFHDIFEAGHDNVLKACILREGLGAPTNIDTLCRLMTQAISLPSLLRFEDRNSMAHGIEARVPFLDPDLADFALGLGARHKINGPITKSILRRALGHTLPPEVLARREKLGFQTPETTWLAGEGSAEFAAGLEDALDLFQGYFNAAPARAWIQSFLDGEAPYTTRLWRVFILARWVRLFDVQI